MFARHANPHVQHISERVVSRREILDEEDIEEDQSRDASALKELDELIMRSMGVAAPLPLPPVAPTVDEPPRKTKRRKTKHQAVVAESDTVPFRLLGTSGSTAPLNLGAKPWVPPAMSERAAPEDGAEAAALRACRAIAIAVDFDWLMAQSSSRPHEKSRSLRPAITVQWSLTTADTLVGVLERPPPPRTKALHKRLRGQEQPSPHQPNMKTDGTVFCPIIPVSNVEHSTHTKSIKRRQGRKGMEIDKGIH